VAQVAHGMFARGEDAVRGGVMVSAWRAGCSELNASGRVRMMTHRGAAARDAGSVRRFTREQARVENDRGGDDRDDEQQSSALRGLHSPIIAVRRACGMTLR
jgi:hypothetical protein